LWIVGARCGNVGVCCALHGLPDGSREILAAGGDVRSLSARLHTLRADPPRFGRRTEARMSKPHDSSLRCTMCSCSVVDMPFDSVSRTTSGNAARFAHGALTTAEAPDRGALVGR